jgi:hypothetical protein
MLLMNGDVWVREREARRLLKRTAREFDELVLSGRLSRMQLYDGGPWWYSKTEIWRLARGE